MELFPNRALVRLRNRARGGYIHADEDGVGVSLSTQRASLNTVWKVQRLVCVEGPAYVLLYGGAYGLYLAFLPQPAPQGQGHRPVQRFYEAPNQDDIFWVPTRAAGDEGDGVRLRHGRHYRCYIGVDDEQSTEWVVEAIPIRPEPPLLPPPMPPPELWRRIEYRWADYQGNWFLQTRRRFMFYGRSVFDLTAELAYRLNQEFGDITLCVRAGTQGRLIPLVVDLPFNEQPVELIVLTTGSPAAMALRHPDVDAP